MDNTTRKAVYVILVSLGLALIFNFLFFGKMLGVSVVIFVVMLLGSVLALNRCVGGRSLRDVWWLVVLPIFFASMLAVRANEFLSFLNVCATFGLLMLLAHQLAGTPVFLMKLREYVLLIILVPFRMLARAFFTISLFSQIHSTVKRRDVWVRIIKGVIMAVPILIVFGLLFSQADLAFSEFLKSVVDINISQRSLQYLLLLLFAFVAGLSFLSYVFFPKERKPLVVQDEPKVAVQTGKGIEMLVFLGLIALLFLIFIGFQITYLFGGESNILNAGFTYAEYARRGFWELLAVAFLSLLILLASEKYSGSESQRNTLFLIPALVMVAEVILVIISAFKRLFLYIDAYGMTIDRFYVAGIISLLFVLFILLIVKFVKSKPEQFFAFGTLLSIAGFIALVNLINPDAHIITYNLKQYNQTGKIDVLYTLGLSADAIPGKLELYNKLEGENKELLRASLERTRDSLENWNDHWQSANVSRSHALEVLKKF